MLHQLRPERVRFGQLECYVVSTGSSPQIPVVICHGYGAPGTDLVSLAPEWINLLGDHANKFQFVFPVAPADLSHLGMPDGRAWWPINMSQLANAIQAERFEELHELEPPGIAKVRGLLVEAIDEIQVSLAQPRNRLVLGGFSQGAMLTMDTALRGLQDPPDLLIQFSGTLVCRSQWLANLAKLKDTAVFQSHGTLDPILPYSSACDLRDLLGSRRIHVKFHAFAGPHTIDTAAINLTAAMMLDVANSKPHSQESR